MTQALQRVFQELEKLPELEQDAIATRLLEEIADEQHWSAQFAATQDNLAKLAQKVRADIQAGKVRDMRVDDL